MLVSLATNLINPCESPSLIAAPYVGLSTDEIYPNLFHICCLQCICSVLISTYQHPNCHIVDEIHNPGQPK
jgi:hypothetical protein